MAAESESEFKVSPLVTFATLHGVNKDLKWESNEEQLPDLIGSC